MKTANKWGRKGCPPDTAPEGSLLTVGVVAALSELVEEMEEVLSARASGARGGGLQEGIGGQNTGACRRKQDSGWFGPGWCLMHQCGFSNPESHVTGS